MAVYRQDKTAVKKGEHVNDIMRHEHQLSEHEIENMEKEAPTEGQLMTMPLGNRTAKDASRASSTDAQPAQNLNPDAPETETEKAGAYSYLGCFIPHGGSAWVISHGGKTWARCRAEAIEAGSDWFALEHPKGQWHN